MSGTMLVHRFYDAISAGRDDELDELLTPDFRSHNGIADDGTRGPQVVRDTIDMLRGGFDGLSFTVEDTVEQGDRVAARWTMRHAQPGDLRAGTHWQAGAADRDGDLPDGW